MSDIQTFMMDIPVTVLTTLHGEIKLNKGFNGSSGSRFNLRWLSLNKLFHIDSSAQCIGTTLHISVLLPVPGSLL